MKILVAINDRTIPAISAARVRNYFLWPALARLGHEVRLLALDLRRDPASAEGPPGIDCRYFSCDRGSLPERILNAARWSYHQWPGSKALAVELDRVTRDWQPDVIHAELLTMAAFLPVVRGQKPSPVGRRTPVQTVTIHNVESDLLQRTGSSSTRYGQPLIEKLHLHNLRSFERRIAEAVDIAFAYSEADAVRYRQLYPTGRWSFTTGGTNASQVEPMPEVTQRQVLLLGTLSYKPNVDGLLWLLERVRPRLSSDISFTVAGANATASLRKRLKREPVRFLDAPPEVAPLYAQHAICCVPLFDGSGTRGRILEALAYGRMVITTTKGPEGLNIPPDHGVIIADEPAAMAAAIERWSVPSDERIEQTARGRAFVMQHFDWSVIATGLAHEWQRCLRL